MYSTRLLNLMARANSEFDLTFVGHFNLPGAY